MSKLPDSWTEVGITAVLVENNNGKPFQQGWSPRCDNYPAPDGEWGVLKTTAIQDGEFWSHQNKRLPDNLSPKPNIEIKPGDILMTCAGPRSRCGVVCTVDRTPQKLMMSGKMYRFRPDSEAMDTKYLSYFIRTRSAQVTIDHMKTGISDSGLNLTHDRFAQLRVPVAPRKEQTRIVAKIEELFSKIDKGVEALEVAQAQLKIYRLSILEHAFTGRLTTQWRKLNKSKVTSSDQLFEHIKSERNNHYQKRISDWNTELASWKKQESQTSGPSKPRPLKAVTSLKKVIVDSLPELPNEWRWEKLGWLTCGVEYGTAAKSSQSGLVPVVRMGNLQNGIIDWTDLAYTSDKAEIDAYLLQYGDVLFNRTNSPELVGKTSIYRGEQPALFAGYLIRIKQIPEIVDSQYLNLFLNSHAAKSFGATVKTDGVNQSNINGEKLQGYPFPYCSLEEQREVVRQLDEKLSLVDRMANDIEFEIRKAKALRKSILKKAFSGQLVSQDSHDEPASALMERIGSNRSSGIAGRNQKASGRKVIT